MSLEDKIWTIAQQPENQPGFTVDLKRMQRAAEEGFCVAFAATQNLHGQTGLHDALAHAEGPNGKGIVGGWYNTGDKQYYFDSVRIFTTRVAAVEAAKVDRQIGMYDLGKREYVPIMENSSFNPSLAAARLKRAQSF